VQATKKARAKEILLFLLVWCLYAFLVYRFWSVYDDAFISFRYARNLAEGHGLRYNLGSHVPVEGYSNFLWVLLLALVGGFHWDVVFWAPFVSFLSGSLLLWLVWRACLDQLNFDLPIAFMATLFLATFPPYALWSSGGLATLPFALCFFLTFNFLILYENHYWGLRAGLAGLIVALLRVEGIAWCLFLALCAVISGARTRKSFWRQLGVFALIVLVGVAIHWVWRYSYYGDLIPNTVRAKGELSGWTLLRGTNYVIVFFLTFLSPFLAVPGSVYLLKTERRGLAVPVILAFWATIGYAILVGGDFMAMGRFLVPALPCLALMVGVLLQGLWRRLPTKRHLVVTALAIGFVLVGLLPLWNIHFVPKAVRSAFHFRHNTEVFLSEMEQWTAMTRRSSTWKVLGKALAEYAQEGDSLVIGPLGHVGYYSNLYLYDCYGLVNREVAALSTREIAALYQLGSSDPIHPRKRSPGHDKTVPTSFFLDKEPTYFSARLFKGDNLRDRITTHVGYFRQQPHYAKYVPDIMHTEVGNLTAESQISLVMRRLRAGESAKETWDAFYRDLGAFLEQQPQNR
jgi:arabinofuranosyltransferase